MRRLTWCLIAFALVAGPTRADEITLPLLQGNSWQLLAICVRDASSDRVRCRAVSISDADRHADLLQHDGAERGRMCRAGALSVLAVDHDKTSVTIGGNFDVNVGSDARQVAEFTIGASIRPRLFSRRSLNRLGVSGTAPGRRECQRDLTPEPRSNQPSRATTAAKMA
jgi:hypothetical protein